MAASRGRSGRPTLAVVAAAANVSTATASRALSSDDHPDIGAETRARIRETAREIGYVPSAAARSLRTGRSRSICMVVTADEWIWWGPVSVGVEEEARARGYGLRLQTWNPAVDSSEDVAARLRGADDSGVVVISMGPVPQLRRTVEGLPAPVVFVDDVNELPDARVLSAANHEGGRLATAHLLETGRRSIAAVIRAGDDRRYVRERLAGYRSALEAAGRRFDDALVVRSAEGWDSPPLEAPEINALFDRRPDIDGVFAAADYLAATVLRVAHARGLAVPGRLGVVGFDDERASMLVHPTLTTVRQPFAELGRAAVRLLDEAAVQDTTVPVGRTELAVELIVRQSSLH